MSDDELPHDPAHGIAATHPDRETQPFVVAPTTENDFNVLSLDLVAVACLKLQDVLFEFDSSFPNTKVATMLAQLPALRESHRNAKGEAPPLSIFGHADPVGDDNYNKQLSGRRAIAIFAVLTRDFALWDFLFDTPAGGDNWKANKFQEVMRKAVGAPTGKSRKELSQAYMDLLCPFQLQKADFLGKGADPKGKADFQGCSEFNPLVLLSESENKTLSHTKRNEENAINRRVLIFLFRAETKVNPKQWPCPTALASTADCFKRFFGPPKTGNDRRKAGSQRRSFAETSDTFGCRFYDRISKLSPCEGPLPLVFRVYDIINVKTPTHIASGKEKIKIEYDIVNKADSSITSATLEILRKKDDKVLKKFDLTPKQFTEGHHADFEWDGTVEKNEEFPDGFVTIEHSDYVVRVAVDGGKGEKKGTAEIKVELKDFTLELGKKEFLKDDDFGKRSKEVVDQIGAIPAAALVKVMLKSNLFAVKDTDMNDHTASTEYQNLWSGGPRIPLVATATVIDSNGSEVRAGKALGRARVVWDYTDPAQSIDVYKAVAFSPATLDAATGHGSDSQGAKPYVDKAREHKKGLVPKNGDNAHTDFDGKRTDNPGPPIFHGSDGGTQSFPFKCNAGATRKWAGLAPFQKDGDEDARAGAIFRPSRMAGDNYLLTAYLDIREKLDVADEKPPSPDREVAIGGFEVWRRVNLIEHFRKNSTVTGVMPTFAEYLADAYIEVKDDRGGVIQDLTKAWYDTEMTAAIGSVTGYPLLKKYALRPVSHWDGGGAAATGWIAAFKSYNTFKNDVKTGESFSNAELATALANNNIETHKKYVKMTAYYAADFGSLLCKKKVTKDGLTILQFDCCSELEPITWKFLNGMAVFTKRKQTGFLLTNTDAGTEQTPAHEIGHCMFLPHAPRVDVNAAGARVEVTSGGGITPDFHDGKNWNCLMSYNRPRPGFCGLCILRLRGYSGDKFDKNGPK